MIELRKNKENKFIGSTGNEVYGGYFFEDYLTELQGYNAVTNFEKMRRGDCQVKMVLNIVKNPIKSATFIHEPLKGDEKSEEIAKFLDWNWFENPNVKWTRFLNEALTFLDFGYCVHETKFARHNYKGFGDVHVIGGLGFRKQSTIERWLINRQVGLYGINQVAYGDTTDTSTDVNIPVQNLLVFTNEQEGENYEGVSLLRACYGPWFRKNTYLKLNAIGIEKAAVGVPIGKYPIGAETDGNRDKFQNILQSFTTNEKSYLMCADNYDIEVIKIDFDSEKIMASVRYEDLQMSKSILVQFLELGQAGAGGAYALGADLSDLAMASFQFIGDYICEKMNEINKQIIEYNFGKQDYIPYPRCSGINEKAGKEIAEIVKSYIDSSVIRPDDTLEKFVRETNNLPEMEKTREETEAEKPKEPAADSELTEFEEPKDKQTYRELSEYEKPIDLEEIREGFDDEKAKLYRLMRSQLLVLNEKSLRAVEALLKKHPNNKTKAATEFNLNVSQYQKYLAAQMAKIVKRGAEQGKKEMNAKGTQFEFQDSFKKELEFLPKHVRDAILLQAKQQAETHKSDIEKRVSYEIVDGSENQLTDKEMISNIEDSLEEFAESGQIKNAAGTIVSQNINRGRNGFFRENIQQIQAFQYSAILDSVTTDICLSLDGKIAKASDPNLYKLRPPNHFNCRSILVPITISEPKPDITGIDIDPTNPNLKQVYKDRGQTAPDLAKIKKSRNI